MNIRFEGDMVENAESFYHMNYANIVWGNRMKRRFAYVVLLALALYMGIYQTFMSGQESTSRELLMLWGLIAALTVGGFFYTRRDVPLGAVVNRKLLRMCLGAEAGDKLEVHYSFYDEKFRADSTKINIDEVYTDVKRVAVTSRYLLLFMGKGRVHVMLLDSIKGGENGLEDLKKFLTEKTGKPVERVPMRPEKKN